MNQFNHASNKRKINNKAIGLFVFFGLLLILSVYLLSPLNKIKTINVKGNKHLPEQTILINSGVNTGMPLWETWLDKKYHENSLVDNVPEIESTSIEIENRQTLNIIVSEYRLIAQMESEEGESVIILENNDIVQNDYSSVSSIPFLINFDTESKEFDNLLEELNETNESVLALISEIELLGKERNPELLKVNMNDGSQVLINILNFANRINYYPLLSDAVDNELGVFDLEAGTFFTPYNSNQSSSSTEGLEITSEEESKESGNEEVEEDEESTRNENN
ncbi:MAG TPA: FtsQ-type POTRA domain-containing protein [Alloiococcus sp.]|nr:FtsQ-type POTRA domain-containing protein [Alloiococcus sp.]